MHLARIALAHRPELPTQIFGGLGEGKEQVAHVELEHQILVAQAAERDGAGAARDEHDVQRGRRVVEQPLERRMAAGIRDVMEVVDDEHEVAHAPGDAAHQRDHGAFDGFVVHAPAAEQARLAANAAIDLREACHEAVDEIREIVVFGGEREPREVEAERQQRFAPRDQGRRLATAGRSLEQDAALAAGLDELGDQALARDDARLVAGRHYAGCDAGGGSLLVGTARFGIARTGWR